MKKRRIMIVVFLLCILTGCKNDDKITLVEKDSEIQGEATITEDESEEEPKDNTGEEDWEQPPIAVRDRETMSKVLEENIEKCEQPPAMELSDFPVEYGLENDVKNVFSQLISVRSDLQYAYNITSEIKEDGLVQCQISYMPYYTGKYPEDFQGIEIGSLTELIQTARTHLAEDSVNIRITNKELQVSDMNSALSGEVGLGYVFCSLSEDGTQIIMKAESFKEEPNLSKNEALERLNRIDELAQAVVNEYTNDSMGKMEKARALYAYLTENVAYDYRYYNDFEHLCDKARTPLGALEDHLAICGGYAQALRVLFEKVGIPAYTQWGFAGEEHMWTIAKIDDTWRLFDATFDAEKPLEQWQCFDVDIKNAADHIPYGDIVDKLIKEADNMYSD